jgi:hypothetical protein
MNQFILIGFGDCAGARKLVADLWEKIGKGAHVISTRPRVYLEKPIVDLGDQG